MSSHVNFADSMQAKRFLVSRIAEEARRDNQPFSDLEEKMLYFSENYPTLPQMIDIAERFEKTVDAAQYEAKVSRIAESAYSRETRQSPEYVPLWNEALKILKKEDHYLLVMLGFLDSSLPAPKVTTNKDQWRLLGYGLMTVFLVGLVIIAISNLKIDVPIWAAAIIVPAIAGAVFRLSKYMERRTK